MNYHPPRLVTMVTAPAAEPVTLAEAKLYLRVDGSEEDSLILDMIAAAREDVEHHIRQALVTQSWELQQRYEPGSPVNLFPGPVQQIENVWIAQHGAESLLDSSSYALSEDKRRLDLFSITADRVRIRFLTGYGDSPDIPAALRQAVLALIAERYENRAGEGEMPPAVHKLLNGCREVKL